MVIVIGLLLLCIATALFTRFLIFKYKFSPIRSSALTTLIIVSLINLILPEPDSAIAALVLGSSFVGMTDRSRLSKRYLTIACLFYSLLFVFLLPLNPGLGGALGVAAFLSCLFTYFARRTFIKRN